MKIPRKIISTRFIIIQHGVKRTPHNWACDGKYYFEKEGRTIEETSLNCDSCFYYCYMVFEPQISPMILFSNKEFQFFIQTKLYF